MSDFPFEGSAFVDTKFACRYVAVLLFFIIKIIVIVLAPIIIWEDGAREWATAMYDIDEGFLDLWFRHS